jgi:hypothetical protein
MLAVNWTEMSKVLLNPGTLSTRRDSGSRLARVRKVFFMRKIRLLTCCGGTNGPKIARMPLGCQGQSPTGNGKEKRKAGYQYERPSRALLRASH